MHRKKMLAGIISLMLLTGCAAGNTNKSDTDTDADRESVEVAGSEAANDKDEAIQDAQDEVADDSKTEIEAEIENDIADEMNEESSEINDQGGFYINGLYFQSLTVDGVKMTLGESTLEEIVAQANAYGYDTGSAEKLMDIDGKSAYDLNISITFPVKGEYLSCCDPEAYIDFCGKGWREYQTCRLWDEAVLSRINLTGSFDSTYTTQAETPEKYNFHELEWDLGNGLTNNSTYEDFVRILGEPEKLDRPINENNPFYTVLWRAIEGEVSSGEIELVYFEADSSIKQLKIYKAP